MGNAEYVKKYLDTMPIKQLDELENRVGIGLSELVVFEVHELIKVYLEVFKKYGRGSELGLLSEGVLIKLQENTNYTGSYEDVERGVVRFYKEYRDTIYRTSELQLDKDRGGNQAQVPHILSIYINQYYSSSPNLMRPYTLQRLVREMKRGKGLKGIKGRTVYHVYKLIEGVNQKGDILNQEIVRYMYFKTTKFGGRLFDRPVMSREDFIKYCTVQVTAGEEYTSLESYQESDDLGMLYIAYLSQKVPYRDTVTLKDKFGVFMNLLQERDTEVLTSLQNNPIFRSTQIYESDGYVLVMRSRIVLIDAMRGQVIINKTPTNIAKKDLEMIIYLLTSK